MDAMLMVSVIGWILTPIMTYVIAKNIVKTEKIIEITDELFSEITTNVEMQKKIYLVGAILGNGIKQGIGITGKGGKFKFEDIIGQAIGGIVGNMFPQKEQVETVKNPFEAFKQ